MADTAAGGIAAIEAAFGRAAVANRAALITYLTAGYPDDATSRRCFEAAADAGADLVEIGLPFSDPMMDGPIIQAANQAVLDSGATVESLLALVADLDTVTVPKVAMTYVTIADTRGYEQFAAECARAGIAGVILPDLPVAEADAWRAAARPNGLATVFMASSVSSDERLAAIAQASQGWIYATGLLGVTGVKTVATDTTRALVGRLRALTSTPIAVGIGVKDRESASEIAAFADGVIVGSAIVSAIGNGEPAGAPDRVHALVTELRHGVDRSEVQ